MNREKISQIPPRKLFVANHPGLYPRGQCGFKVNEQPYASFLVPFAGSPLDSGADGQLGKRLLIGGIGQRVERPARRGPGARVGGRERAVGDEALTPLGGRLIMPAPP